MVEIWYRLRGDQAKENCYVNNMAVFADAVEHRKPIIVYTVDARKQFYLNTSYVVSFGPK